MQNSVRRMMGTVTFLTVLTACGGQAAELATGSDTAAESLQGTTFRVCESTPYTPSKTTGFNSWSNALLSSQGVYPVAQDVITLPNSDFNATSWFALGTLRVGAGDENVVAKLDHCGSWDTLGSATTNKDGRAMVKNNQLSEAGRYNVTHEMLADGSAITTSVTVLPAGTHFVVFDIDGTLTTDNGQFIRQQLNPSYVPVAFPAAQAATQAWVDKGYVVLYLTGRPTDAAVATRTWLTNLGFPKGPTHLTEMSWQMMPSNEGVGTFKKQFLQSLLDKGYHIDFAYGNETTDMYAYEGIGLDANQVFMLGPKAGTSDTHGLPQGYADNLAFIDAAPVAGQPFSF